MVHAPRITDESVITRWMGIEVARMNEGIVRDRKTLAVLLDEDEPSAFRKDGTMYRFNREVLGRLAGALPEELRLRLKLPVLFFQSPDVEGSCSCGDEPAFRALATLGEISSLRTMEKGKFWLSRPIAYAILGKYPTAFQIVIAP